MTATTPRVDPDLVAALRADLVTSRFTVAGVTDLLGPMAAAALDREQALPAQRVTATSVEPCATLVRLFTLGDPVDVAEAAAALPSLGVDGAVALGLVAPEGDGVVARCDLRPYAADGVDWWVASDLGELATGAPLREDHVLGIGGASATLAAWTPRPHVERALDLGTGCGVQALHLGGHADEVVVTDLSERALAYARFNAALDEADVGRAGRLDARPGRGRAVRARREQPAVRHHAALRRGAAASSTATGERRGMPSSRDLVRAVGEHLEPGGIAQFLGNWEVPRGTTWTDRVGAWLDGTGLDAWVVQREVQDPAEYAETWVRDGGHHPGTADFNAMYAAWLDDFAARDVESIGFGVVTLQRPRTDRAPFVDLMEVTVAGGVADGPARARRRSRRAPGSPSTTTTPCSTSPGRARPTSTRSGTDAGRRRPERHRAPPGRRAAPAPHADHGDRGVRLGLRRRAHRPGRRGGDRRAARPRRRRRCGPRSWPSCATRSRTASCADRGERLTATRTDL